MKLPVYEVADGHIAELGMVTKHDSDDPLHGVFPPARGPGNEPLSPADGNHTSGPFTRKCVAARAAGAN